MSPANNGGATEIFILDDDTNVCDALRVILKIAGYDAICFADEVALLNGLRQRNPLCILLDVQLPGRSGLEILKDLAVYPVPVLMISGRAEIPVAVTAIKSGALDFIEKPFRGQEVISRLEKLLKEYRPSNSEARKAKLYSLNFPGRKPLTRRECEVLQQITLGLSSKEAASELGISYRTVESHRARLMRKLGVRNSVELTRTALTGV